MFAVLEKYTLYNKNFITLVVQYGNDVSPARLYFHSPLALKNAYACL